MYAIVGAAGKVGYATASTLRQSGARVRAILRDASKAARLADLGCEIALADLQDTAALAETFVGVDAVQVIVPLRPQEKDPVADMRRSIVSLITALEQTRSPRVLAISDYGAHIDRDIGMPSIFRDYEAQLGQLGHLGCRTIALRSAEHMENWARLIPTAFESGHLPTFLDPVDRAVPTISAPDLGRIAAALLLRAEWQEGLAVYHAEGPARYSANDVARALSQLAGRKIQARSVPRDQWDAIMKRSLPPSLATLLIQTSEAVNQGAVVDIQEKAGEVRYGTTALIDALIALQSTTRSP